MKKIIVGVIVLIIITGGVYLYKNNSSSSSQLSQSEIDRFEQAVQQRKAEETANPPKGFLIPKNVPVNYVLKNDQTRFTTYSTYFSYKSEQKTQFGNIPNYLQFSETTKNTFSGWLKKETGSSVQMLRVVKEFTHNGNKGSVVGVFGNENEYKQLPFNTTEKWLAYDNNGRLVLIHSIDNDISVDILINLLKTMEIK
jgi:hypothetical protein